MSGCEAMMKQQMAEMQPEMMHHMMEQMQSGVVKREPTSFVCRQGFAPSRLTMLEKGRPQLGRMTVRWTTPS